MVKISSSSNPPPDSGQQAQKALGLWGSAGVLAASGRVHAYEQARDDVVGGLGRPYRWVSFDP